MYYLMSEIGDLEIPRGLYSEMSLFVEDFKLTVDKEITGEYKGVNFDDTYGVLTITYEKETFLFSVTEMTPNKIV